MKKASNTDHRLRLTAQFSLLLALSFYLIGYMFYYAQVAFLRIWGSFRRRRALSRCAVGASAAY
ncbi:MAG: hypothetical protein WCJ09_12230 [Planctomycetota bacterium]